ncbi:hypothetical protein [Endozoicomonas ascidiicola]|uniref:hypothetical protein n=1 Tax=Endozoicomonas ascidiicola TaxID=1698521 RepID=UPI00083624CC|nr:hypothetical protein [Endozoicomonas ascidiicola]
MPDDIGVKGVTRQNLYHMTSAGHIESRCRLLAPENNTGVMFTKMNERDVSVPPQALNEVYKDHEGAESPSSDFFSADGASSLFSADNVLKMGYPNRLN